MPVSSPVFTDSVNQNFFIEALGGSKQPVSYLDRFPDSVYTKAIDSVLVTFAYALLGPAGAGYLRTQYLEARLQIEQAGLTGGDLDQIYTAPFAFARTALETYSTDASAALLPSQERQIVQAADASFRNRAITYFKAIRAGGTLLGLTLAAESGLNHPVDIIENWLALFDQYADIPLGLPYMGSTTNLNEVIVLPRKNIPENAKQSFVLNGEPTSGWFTLSLPIGPNYRTIQIGTTNGSNVITVPNSAQTPPGTYLTIAGSPVNTYAQVGMIQSPTSVSLIYPPQSTTAGQPLNLTVTGAYTAYAGNAQTVPLPYNATYAQIQSALWVLPIVGGSNDLKVTGGPLPDQPVDITFIGSLGDQPIPMLQVNLAPDSITGIGGPSAVAPLVSQPTDILNNPLVISSNVTVDQAGVSNDSQHAVISPGDSHAMEVAMDILRPETSFITTQWAQGTTQRQPANTVFTGQTYTEVLRYETGNSGIGWPSTDSTHWIEGGKEHEAPKPVGNFQQNYQSFHNVTSIQAYTEAALLDSGYGTGSIRPGNIYWNTKIGAYSPAQTAFFPFLENYGPDTQYSPSQALAVSPEPLVITHNLDGTGVINAIYPADYLSLSGIPQLPTTQTFWSSLERPGGIDYLEIDLGTTQAVNYLYFEATNKPYAIDVNYDILDQTPSRNFAAVTPMPSALAQSTTALVYDTAVTNPWTVAEFHFTNTLNQMIFTRYLRIGFTRTPAGSPFAGNNGAIPYSIEVRNLRIGRNLASPMDRIVTIG